MKNSNSFIYNETKHNEKKKRFYMNCLQCCSSSKVSTGHQEVCLKLMVCKVLKYLKKITLQNLLFFTKRFHL